MYSLYLSVCDVLTMCAIEQEAKHTNNERIPVLLYFSLDYRTINLLLEIVYITLCTANIAWECYNHWRRNVPNLKSRDINTVMTTV